MPWFRRPPPPPPPQPQSIISSILDLAATDVPLSSSDPLHIAVAVVNVVAALVLVHMWWSARRERLDDEAAAERIASARRALALKTTFDHDDLRHHVGLEGGPILLAMGGDVYDVSEGREFYGAHGPYHALTGADATRLLAKGLLEPESAEEAARPLLAHETQQLEDWRVHYATKYRKLGPLVSDAAAGGAAPPRQVVEPAEAAVARLQQPAPPAAASQTSSSLSFGFAPATATVRRGEDADARRAKIRAAQLAAAQQRQQAQ